MNKMLNPPQIQSIRHHSRAQHALFPKGAFPNSPYTTRIRDKKFQGTDIWIVCNSDKQKGSSSGSSPGSRDNS